MIHYLRLTTRSMLFVAMLLLVSATAMAQEPFVEQDDSTMTADSILALPLKKHPWLAAGAVTALNTSVQLYNRYLKHEDFAQTTMHTVHNNLRTGFVWDNDMFIMNMFAHPYHGNLYFNVARSNGMNF